VFWPLFSEAWVQCPIITPTAPCLHPTVQEPILSHEKILAHVRVRPIPLMPTIQKNQLHVWTLLHLSACDVPPTTAHPSPVGVALVLSGVAPSAHATPSLLIPFSSYFSPSCDLLVTLLPLLFNSHSCLFYKWICSKVSSLFLLHTVDNLSLPFVAHWYA